MKFVHLLKVDPNANNNKYYKMTEKSDGTFIVEFGREGSSPQTRSYSMRKWNSKYNEKVKSGYKDITEFVTLLKTEDAKLTDDTRVNRVLEKLLSASRNAFSQTYRVSASSVTHAQIQEAQRLINLITVLTRGSQDMDKINQTFVELWHVIPRSLKNVRDALPKNITQAITMLGDEQDSIDNANVQKAFVQNEESVGLLDNLAVSLEFVSSYDETLSELCSGIKYTIDVFKLRKPELEQRFVSFVNKASDKTTALRFHGTRWKNGMAILQTGLKILGSRSSTYSGSMLGDAIYTSRDFNKSYPGYSDGLVLVLDTHIGKALNVNSSEHIRHYSFEELQRLGYHSVNAEPGVHTGWVTLQKHEQTIYHQDQHNFKYLISVNN